MMYVIYIASGIFIGFLLWQLMKGGKFGLWSGLSLFLIGVLFGGYIFPKLGITFGELIFGIAFIFAGALISVFIIKIFYGRRND